ncbi:SPOR domain-containing protein [Rhodobacterales bacterium HKCCE2091]|nr:SPOR domain-containing protein [Rhodobacterales bacterium HKCCE2091]
MTAITRFHLWARTGILAAGSLVLAGCDEGLRLPFGATGPAPEVSQGANPAGRMVGNEVEAPEVFSTSESGLWDGRPSLGGVWVAHPDVVDPERVLITNAETGQSVAGALFRRERENPGPALQVSSDAAAALNVIAGQPTELTVVALRRVEEPAPLDLAVAPPPPAEDVAEALPDLPEAPAAAPVPQTDIAAIAAAAIPGADAAAEAEALPAETPLEVITRAEAAIDRDAITADTAAIRNSLPAAVTGAAAATGDEVTDAMPLPSTAPFETAALDPLPAAEPAPAAAATPAPTPAANTLERPYVQVGIFTRAENAEDVADALRSAGVVPTVHEQTNANGTFWRVVAGPAPNVAERASLLETIQGLGYQDAYAVTN